MISFTTLHILIAIIWFISATIDYTRYLQIWQLKEYRIDRMRDFMSSKQGQEFYKSYPLITRAVMVIGIYVFLKEIIPLPHVIGIIFSIDLIYNIYALRKKMIRRPTITKKIILITLISFSIEIGLLILTKSWQLMLLFLAFRFIILSAVVVTLYYPTHIAKILFVLKAKAKIKKYKNLTVIGITGSYGKTTTKTYLTQILKNKYKVISTQKNINTEIGIAKHILATDFSNIDIYIVEMGAYRKGDIKIIANMVQPKIGILTAINEEHLSLFGTIENTINTKYELLRAIPKDGLVITNADNNHALKYIHELKANIETFGVDEDNKPNLIITNTKSKKEDGIYFESTYQQNHSSYSIKNIHGTHNSTNIAACIIVAKKLKLTDKEITKEIEQLKPPEDRLNICSYGKATIINDSYNANPDGFRAALDVLGGFSLTRERIVITRGMIELGSKSDQIHQNMAEEISFYANKLIVISKDSYEPFARGILPKYKITIDLIDDRQKLLSYFQSLKNQDVVVLLENRMPSVIYKELESYQHDCKNQ